MYHYYSSKDELFLLCAEKTFADLKGYIEENIEGITGHSVLDRVKHYFMLREYYFQQHPRQKAIFEGALIHPPRHLAEEIQNLRAPLRAMNRTFLAAQAAKMQLRPGLSQEKAVRYLESVEYLFWDLVRNYQSDQESAQLHTILQAGEELLEMALFGILQQGETE